jgi:hypothetical protein
VQGRCSRDGDGIVAGLDGSVEMQMNQRQYSTPEGQGGAPRREHYLRKHKGQ